jgi:hypothetical protein
MRVLSIANIEEIEVELLALGGGNHTDNMEQVRAHQRHYRGELCAATFWKLVFLENSAIARLRRSPGDRTIRGVAIAARRDGYPNLGPNWDLGAIRSRSLAEPAIASHQSWLLRDSRATEAKSGPWYLQDGCHRALSYAITLLEERTEFTPRSVFLATNRILAIQGA